MWLYARFEPILGAAAGTVASLPSTAPNRSARATPGRDDRAWDALAIPLAARLSAP